MIRWKIVKTHPDYEVSDQGQVRREGHILKAGLQSSGYPTVRLYQGIKRSGATYLVHRLVLEAFVGPCPNGQQCRHINGDKADNRVSNLTWGTAKENAADRKTHGTQTYGEDNHKSKLTTSQVKAIKMDFASGGSVCALARKYGISTYSVSAIRYGVSWSHVPWPHGFTPPVQKPKLKDPKKVTAFGRPWIQCRVIRNPKTCRHCSAVLRLSDDAYRPLQGDRRPRLCEDCVEEMNV